MGRGMKLWNSWLVGKDDNRNNNKYFCSVYVVWGIFLVFYIY